MRDLPKPKLNSKRPLLSSGVAILLLLFLLAACSSEPETIIVEVTRVVTETVTVEGETVEIEVTRVVTETVVEEVEIEPDEEPPSATGTEEDSGPLPPPPENGPKVSDHRGSTTATAIALETAVTLRASQINTLPTSLPASAPFSPPFNPEEMQKWCQLINLHHKKQCRN